MKLLTFLFIILRLKRRTSGSTSSLGPQVSGDGSSKSLFGRKLAKAQPSDAEVIDS